MFSGIAKPDVIPGGVTKSGTVTITAGITLRSMWLSMLTLPGNLFNKRFQLVCECVHEGLTSSYTVHYRGKIRSPTVSSYPDTGYSYDTEYDIRVHGWYAGYQNKPLSFRFGYKPDANTIPVQYLTGWTSVNTLSGVKFPMLGAGVSSTLKLFVHIKNEDNEFQQIDGVANVNKLQGSNKVTIVKILQNNSIEYSNFDLFKTVSALIQYTLLTPNLNTLSVSSSTSLDVNDVQSVYMKMIDLFISLPSTPESANAVIGTLGYFVKKTGGRIHPDLVEKIKELFLHLASSLKDLEGDFDYIEQVGLIGLGRGFFKQG